MNVPGFDGEMWKARADSEPHWLNAERVDQSGNVWHEATWIRFDGCFHYSRYFNAPKGQGSEEDVDTFHVCSAAEVVDDMLAVIELGSEHHANGDWDKERERLAEALARHGWVRKP